MYESYNFLTIHVIDVLYLEHFTAHRFSIAKLVWSFLPLRPYWVQTAKSHQIRLVRGKVKQLLKCSVC